MRQINACLNKQLASLFEKALELEALDKRIKCLLPETLALHCQVGSFNKGHLVLIAENASWATALRYVLPDLRDKLRKEDGLHHLTGIKLSLNQQTNSASQRMVIKPPARLSDNAKGVIYNASETCEYEPLKKALERLAR